MGVEGLGHFAALLLHLFDLVDVGLHFEQGAVCILLMSQLPVKMYHVRVKACVPQGPANVHNLDWNVVLFVPAVHQNVKTMKRMSN